MSETFEAWERRHTTTRLDPYWTPEGDGSESVVEELAVASNDVWELAAAVMQMKESPRPVKILTVPAEQVRKTALIFQSLGVEGVVRDPMGLVVVPVATVS